MSISSPTTIYKMGFPYPVLVTASDALPSISLLPVTCKWILFVDALPFPSLMKKSYPRDKDDDDIPKYIGAVDVLVLIICNFLLLSGI